MTKTKKVILYTLLTCLVSLNAGAETSIFPQKSDDPYAIKISHIQDHNQSMLRFELCLKRRMDLCERRLGNQDFPQDLLTIKFKKMASQLTHFSFSDYVAALLGGVIVGAMSPIAYDKTAKFMRPGKVHFTDWGADLGNYEGVFTVMGIAFVATTGIITYVQFKQNRARAIDLVKTLSFQKEDNLSWDAGSNGVYGLSKEIENLIIKLLYESSEA